MRQLEEEEDEGMLWVENLSMAGEGKVPVLVEGMNWQWELGQQGRIEVEILEVKEVAVMVTM